MYVRKEELNISSGTTFISCKHILKNEVEPGLHSGGIDHKSSL